MQAVRSTRATRAQLLASFVLACSAYACHEDPGEQGASEPPVVGITTAAVVGGEPVTTCQWPSTVMVNSCTATLIHPRVVTTAAHCLNGSSAMVTFGGTRNSPGAFTLSGRCRAGAQGSRGGGSSRDWGYCVIPDDERVKQIPYTPPLVGCEAERFLKAGASGWVVGYGTTGPSGMGFGVKREVEVKVNRVTNGTVDVGDREVGACHGDSGGPIYMELSEGGQSYGVRVFGSTSSAGMANCDCTCSTLYVNIAMHVAAIEENEGIDVTPCTDAEGKWAPSAECNALSSGARAGTGTFPACSTARTQTPIASCGPGSSGPAAGGGGSLAAGSGGAAGRGTAGSGAAGRSAAGSGGVGAVAGSMSAGTWGGTSGSGASGGTGVAGALAGGAGAATAGAGGVGGASSPPAAGANAFGGAAGLVGTFAGVAGSVAGPGLSAPAIAPLREDSGCHVASAGSRAGHAGGGSLVGFATLIMLAGLVRRGRRR